MPGLSTNNELQRIKLNSKWEKKKQLTRCTFLGRLSAALKIVQAIDHMGGLVWIHFHSESSPVQGKMFIRVVDDTIEMTEMV